MLKNDDNKILNKLILATFLALLGSLLSTLYISTTKAADMYMHRFTEQELTDINAFYITPVGQKVITVLPELVQQRNQLAMMRLQQNIGELQQIIGAPGAAAK